MGLTFTVVLLILDFVSGPRISFALFYLMPLGLVTWNLGRRAGIGTALICTVATLVADLVGPGPTTTWSRTGTRSDASPCSSRSRCCSPP